MTISVILHNIRSAHNVGSIFRTSDGAGVSKIYLTGYTPAPTDRFGRNNKEIEKTSLGATENVAHESTEDAVSLIKNLKEEGKCVVAVEQTDRSTDYKKFKISKDTVFVFGNEITGIEREVLDLCDAHVELPMQGKKESLNVAVCAGVILYHFS
jgi:tRNA G18 (ribose-2'-O)-methylase SpoU